VWIGLRGRGWVGVLRGGGECLYGVPRSIGLDDCVSMAYSIPRPGVPLWIRKGAVFGWVPMYGSGPRGGGGEWATHVVSPMDDVRGVCSTRRASLSLGPLQPVGLMARGGRVLPPICLWAEGSARYACYGRLPSRILRRRVGSLALVVTRCFRMADKARKRSINIHFLVVATRRGGGRGVRRVARCLVPVGCGLRWA